MDDHGDQEAAKPADLLNFFQALPPLLTENWGERFIASLDLSPWLNFKGSVIGGILGEDWARNASIANQAFIAGLPSLGWTRTIGQSFLPPGGSLAWTHTISQSFPPPGGSLAWLGPDVSAGLLGGLFGSALSPNSWSAITAAAANNLVEGQAGIWARLASLPSHILPPNLQAVEDLRVSDLQPLADEGLAVWAVPSTPIVERFLAADDRAARRVVLGRYWRTILEDCSAAASRASSGPYAAQANFLEQAIGALLAGHTAAAQALAASTLDTVLAFALTPTRRTSLVTHSQKKAIDHFDDLSVREALVFRPIWQAYRPQNKPSDRAGTTTFSRHGMAHHLTARQVNRRNAVQGVMLVTALLDYVTFWD